MEVRDIDVLEQWWRAGALPRWATISLAVATLTTIVLAHVGGHHYAADLFSHSFWLQDGLAFGLAAVAALAWLPAARVSRAARVAIVLPLAHVAAIAVAWTVWCALLPRAERGWQPGPLLRSLPLHVVVVAAAIATAGVARMIAWRRRGEWLHAAVMLALVHLLLAGLWLSVAAQLWCRANRLDYATWREVDLALGSRALAAFVLLPPFVAASAFTALAIRRFDLVRCARKPLAVAIVLGVIAAALLRSDRKFESGLVYGSFIHVVLALVIVAAGALGVLALALRRRERSGEELHGTVAVDSERGAPVACVQIAGWLRGPRAIVREHTVVTPHGSVLVPADARVHRALPACSTRLASGEAIAVIREGDRVALAGYVTPDADHPFRTSSVPVPGPRGVEIRVVSAESHGVASVALALWRPCLAYLAVVVAVALPALAALAER